MPSATDIAVFLTTSLLAISFVPRTSMAEPSAPFNLCLKSVESECNPDRITPPTEASIPPVVSGTEVPSSTGKKRTRGYYLMISRPDVEELNRVNDHPAIVGIMKNIPWKRIEGKENQYDWSEIERDLKVMAQKKKQIGYQIMTTAFNDEKGEGYAPEYLTKNPIYGGGLLKDKYINRPGKATKPIALHNPAVSQRLNKLVAEFAKRFDNHPNFEVLIFQETSYPVDCNEAGAGFSQDKYWSALTSRIDTAQQYFKKSNVLQRVNYWPCPGPEGQKYHTDRLIRYAAARGIGTGQPDLHFRPGSNLEESVYPLQQELARTQPDLVRGISIQWDNYETASVKKMFDFARNTLKVSYLTILPRNGEPRQPNWYSRDVLPYLSKNPKL